MTEAAEDLPLRSEHCEDTLCGIVGAAAREQLRVGVIEGETRLADFGIGSLGEHIREHADHEPVASGGIRNLPSAGLGNPAPLKVLAHLLLGRLRQGEYRGCIG
jgi:hypothetical protein